MQTSDPLASLIVATTSMVGVTLAPNESQEVTVAIDSEVVLTFDKANDSWKLANGEYEVLVGSSSASTPLKAHFSDPLKPIRRRKPSR